MPTFKEFLKVAELTVKDKTSGKRSREIMGILHAHQVTKGINPQKTVDILEALGPTFVKMGQIASNRSDILPAAYCEAFQQLRANVQPMPFETVCELIDKSYGRSHREVFSSIEQTPLGSASIAQVHRAVLHDGSTVAVKVRRPGIEEQMAEDIMLLRHLLALAEFSAPPDTKNITLTMEGLVDELARTTAEELDFNTELENLVRFRSIVKNQAGVTSPTPYPQYTTDGVLVMEFVEGSLINDPASGLDKEQLAELGDRLAQSYVAQVVDEGFFHADPHPGNIIVRDGQIVWIDLGMTGSLASGEKALVSQMFEAVGTRDIIALKDALLGLARPQGAIDHGLLLQQIQRLMSSYAGADLASIDIGQALVEIVELVRSQGLALPPSITMLGRGFVTLEGVLAEIAPQTNVVGILSEHVKQQLENISSVAAKTREAFANAAASATASTRIPKQLSDTLDMLDRGELKLGMDIRFRREFRGALYTVSSLMALALLSAGLFVGSSILCATSMEPRIFEVPVLGVLGYLGAAVLGVYVVVLAWGMRHRQRNGEEL